jgi:hypothetical protein
MVHRNRSLLTDFNDIRKKRRIPRWWHVSNFNEACKWISEDLFRCYEFLCVEEIYIYFSSSIFVDIVVPSRSVVWTREVLGIPEILQAQFQTARRSQTEGVSLGIQRCEGLPCSHGKFRFFVTLINHCCDSYDNAFNLLFNPLWNVSGSKTLLCYRFNLDFLINCDPHCFCGNCTSNGPHCFTARRRERAARGNQSSVASARRKASRP